LTSFLFVVTAQRLPDFLWILFIVLFYLALWIKEYFKTQISKLLKLLFIQRNLTFSLRASNSRT